MIVSYSKFLWKLLSLFLHPANPADLVFFVTSQCNCNCHFCLFRDALNEPDRKKNILTLQEIEKIVKNYGGPVVKLSLSGGEPFLRKDIVEILETFVRFASTKIIDIPTNGSQPDIIEEKVQQFLGANPGVVLEIQLSVDGTKNIHEKIRELPGLFDKVLETYARLDRIRTNNNNLKIKMNMLYQPENQDDIMKIYTWFLENNYLFNRFQIVFPHGSHIANEVNSKLEFDKFYQLSQYILRNYPHYSKKDFHSLIFRAIKIERDNVLSKAIKNKNMGNICKAGKRNIVLDDIGDVFPCEPLWQSIGNIRDFDYSIKKICHSQEFQKFKNKNWGKQNCHCTWGNIALDEVVYSPRYYPKIIINVFKLLKLYR